MTNLPNHAADDAEQKSRTDVASAPVEAIQGKTSGEGSTTQIVGHTIGHFTISSRLGSGAMAAVYRATDQILGREVALKVLMPGSDEIVRERFRREARTLSTLEHPHIVPTLQVGQADGYTYIAMELIEGISLSDLLTTQGKLSVADSCQLLEPIARALTYAHRRQVVHRDVKPSNILLRRAKEEEPNGRRITALAYPVTPLLTDFGIALALDLPELTAAGRTIGTPTYMAPEQASGSREIDGRADLYALGTVLYRCIIGRPPFSGSTTQVLHAHVYEPLTIPEEMAQQLSPRLLALLSRLLAKDPAERYADAALLADDLQTLHHPTSWSSDDSTATLASVSAAPAQPTVERQRVLVSAPLPKSGQSKTANPPAVQPLPTTPLPTLKTRPTTRNWLGILAGSILALSLVTLGVALITTVLPLNQLMSSDPTSPTPSSTVSQAPLLAPTSTAIQPAATSTPSPTEWMEPPTPTAGSEANAPITTNTPTLVPTIDIDVELFWESAIDDYYHREWNKTLSNLVLILRSEDDSFNQALANNKGSQARLVLTLLLIKPEAPLWARWQQLFDTARLEEMFFHTYTGLATLANGRRDPQNAIKYFDEALVLRPTASKIQGLRSATENFLSASESEREARRVALGVAHQAYADSLATEEAFCDIYDHLRVAGSLLESEEFENKLTDYEKKCEQLTVEQIGNVLRTRLSGAIIYSTQEHDQYTIYRQPLAPDSAPILLVIGGTQPRVSPDGRSLAYYQRRGNTLGLSRFDLTRDTNLQGEPLTTGPSDAKDSPPTWNPAGGRLAFASQRETDNRSRIYIKTATANNDAVSLIVGQDPAWRPMGDSIIAYSGRDKNNNQPGLWLISDDGVNLRPLTSIERDRRPTWTPDASQLVFMSDGRDGNWEIYRLDLQTQTVTRLTTSPTQDGLPSISPDGEYVAFVSDEGGVWRIWVTPLDGSAQPTPLMAIKGSLVNWLEHAIHWVNQ
jgi:serine/threonine-protein kinase